MGGYHMCVCAAGAVLFGNHARHLKPSVATGLALHRVNARSSTLFLPPPPQFVLQRGTLNDPPGGGGVMRHTGLRTVEEEGCFTVPLYLGQFAQPLTPCP